MPSHLTRHVFRRLLANQPIVHRGCLRRQAYSSIAVRPVVSPANRHRNGSVHYGGEQQRRDFFNFNIFRKKKDVQEADMDPGIEKMMELEKLQRMRARLPPPKDVAVALNEFAQAKKAQKRPIEDNQARLALQSLTYCVQAQGELSALDSDVLLTNRLLGRIASALRSPPKRTTEDHVRLAKAVYDQLPSGPNHTIAVLAYVAVLCRVGDPQSARDIVLAYEKRLSRLNTDRDEAYEEEEEEEPSEQESVNSARHDVEAPQALRKTPMMWAVVLDSFVRQMDREGVFSTLKSIRQRSIQDHKAIPAAMLRFHLAEGDGEGVERWWQEYRRTLSRSVSSKGEDERTAGIIGDMLRWCLDNGRLEMGHTLVREIMQENPEKAVWDAIFVWAAGTGKGVDEIARMLDVMERSNESIPDEEQWRRPDVATINALVEFAVSRDDPYMAERFIALGKDRGIEPDARTYVLQIEYRLRVNDTDGALTAYKNLQAMDLSSDEDVPTVNKLIVALCSSKRHDFDTIMNVAADLSDRRARFDPLTVSTLGLLHLNRDEVHDVIDLLNTHAYHFSSTERATVRDTLVTYALDLNTPTSRAWDAYTILRQIFDELPREPRTEVMTSFFARSRPDMAVHIFNHMRAHSRLDTMPTTDTYIAAFMGTARLNDIESLEVLHNQLKLDYNIDLTTRLRNALLIAYAACGKPRKALGFWDDIVASREGPSYNSIHIALRACERSPFGDLKAQEIWTKLRKLNLDLDSSMWASYVAALAGNGDTATAMTTLEQAEDKGEVEVDKFVLGSLFAAAPGQVKQKEVEAWAKGRWSRVWSELEALGWQEDEGGMRLFKLDRSVAP